MTQTSFTKSLTMKELVTVGIFSALFLTFGSFFALNPALTFYMPAGGTLLCGTVYLLMTVRVQKAGRPPCPTRFSASSVKQNHETV